MHMKVSLLAAATLAACVSTAQAQSVVPPPKPLFTTPGQAETSSSAPAVLPPAQAASFNPAEAAAAPVAAPARAQPQGLLEVAIPAAPRPEPTRTLTPQAPNAAAAVAAPAKAAKPSKPEAAKSSKSDNAPKKAADPFSGIIGTPVSDSQLNRFVFPEGVEGVYFQEGAPLPECPQDANEFDPCKPIFLNGKRVMLLQLRAGAKGPVQMMVHLASGRFETLNLMPTAGPGAVVRVDGAEDGASDSRLAKASSAAGVPGVGGGMAQSEQNVEILSRIARGEIPAGFEPVNVSGRPVRFELFDVIQMASWDNESGLRAHMFQVVAHTATPVALSPSLFRHETVQALALDRETITNTEPAILFMLERVETEAQ